MGEVGDISPGCDRGRQIGLEPPAVNAKGEGACGPRLPQPSLNV